MSKENETATLVRVYEYGPPSVLNVEKGQVGKPGPGQARIRQQAIGVNFVDTMFRDGTFAESLPFTAGIEATGVIEELHPDVKDFTVGDRVAYFFAPGSYASKRLVEAASLIKLPGDISAEMAASILTKGLTAWMGLRSLYTIKSGEIALVQGASGSVGRLLSRWARHLGVMVIGTTGSAAKRDTLSNVLNHAFLSNASDLIAQIKAVAPHGVDVVYELVGQATFASSVAVVRDGGTIVTIGAASGEPSIDEKELTRRKIRITGGGMPDHVKGRTVSIATSELFDVYRKGVFGEIEINRYPLTEAVRAHEDIAGRNRAGFPVLVP